MISKIFRNIFITILTAFLMLSFSGCGKKEPVPEETIQETEEIGLSSYRFEFDPHVISKEYISLYGEGIVTEFYAFCDAILEGRDSFSCSSKERFHQLLGISMSCFPIASELIDRDNVSVENGICHLSFRYEKERCTKMISSFQKKVSDVITSAIPKETSDEIKAIELYTAVCRKDTYDFSSTLEDSLKLRPYRAIMEDIGICQEIAGEYIYYLLQVGIDAITCSALSRDQSEAHEWVLVKLNGNWYHMDPTYGTQYPDSLYFFGMDDVQREYYGDFPAERFTYMDADVSDKSRYAATDRTYVKYWLAERYEIDFVNKKITVWEIDTGDRHDYEIEE